MLDREKLLLTFLGVQASLLSPPQGHLIAPAALGAKDVSTIYGELARYGFANFQLVPGGGQMATADGVSVLTLTGAAMAFQEDLSRSAFPLATDRLGVAMTHFREKLPEGTLMMTLSVDLQAQWEGSGIRSDEFVSQIYLKDAVRRLGQEIPNLEYQGSGVRITLNRPAEAPLPPGVTMEAVPGGLRDAFDIRIEPLFADKTKLFLQVVGMFAVTSDMKSVVPRIQEVQRLLYDTVAPKIALLG
jgi:hypothetical protein